MAKQERIVVRRAGALGDVILTTPVVARLKRERPDALVEVETQHPEIFWDNPNVDAVWATGMAPSGYSVLHNLDLAYESQPAMHVIEAYMQAVFGDRGSPELNATFLARNEPAEVRDLALIHAGRTWPSRSLPESLWVQVANELRSLGLRVAFVGHGADYRGPGLQGFGDYVSQFNIRTLATLMQGSAVIIGSDSSLLHIAGTTDIPIVGLYTCAKGVFRAPYRYGALGGKMTIVAPEIACYGCLATVAAPVTNYSCKRGDNACISLFDAESVARTAFRHVVDDGRCILAGANDPKLKIHARSHAEDQVVDPGSAE